MTGRKGALTTYYPEETRWDSAPGNRGKHVLTQRPDGSPQCIACNMCATVCPAKVIEIDAAFDPNDPAHPKYPSRFEIDYSRCIFCGMCVEACPEDAIRMVKETPGLPTGDRDHMWLNLTDLIHWNPQSDVAKPYHRAMRRPFPSRLAPRQTRRRCHADPRPNPGAPNDQFPACPPGHGAALRVRAVRLHRRGADAGLAAPDAGRYGAHLDDGVPGRHLWPARRALHRGVSGADLRQRGDGVHGVRDHVAGRARCIVYAPVLALALPESPSARFCSRRWVTGSCSASTSLATTSVSFGLAQFSAAFLSEYWLQFELTSVLLVAAVEAALAVIKGSRRRDRG